MVCTFDRYEFDQIVFSKGLANVKRNDLILRTIRVILAAVLLACTSLLWGTASANSWGLKGKLLTAVMADHAWDDYSTLSNQEGPFAVMKSRYHHALFFVDSQNRLHVYTTAVY